MFKKAMCLVAVLCVGQFALAKEVCYKMAVKVPNKADFATSTDINLQLKDKFCFNNAVYWVTDKDGIDNGSITFVIKGPTGLKRASYTMIYSAGDAAAGTSYITYTNDKQHLLTPVDGEDNSYLEIVVATNNSATEANPNFYGRVKLFGDTEFYLTK